MCYMCTIYILMQGRTTKQVSYTEKVTLQEFKKYWHFITDILTLPS